MRFVRTVTVSMEHVLEEEQISEGIREQCSNLLTAPSTVSAWTTATDDSAAARVIVSIMNSVVVIIRYCEEHSACAGVLGYIS